MGYSINNIDIWLSNYNSIPSPTYTGYINKVTNQAIFRDKNFILNFHTNSTLEHVNIYKCDWMV